MKKKCYCCDMNVEYGIFCLIHVSGPIDTTDPAKFFYEALSPAHVHGRWKKNKTKWCNSLFKDLNKFRDCRTLEEVYNLVKRYIKALGGKDPKVFLYDVTVKICRKYNIPIENIPERGLSSGGPKDWLPFIGNKRNPNDVYEIMRSNISDHSRGETEEDAKQELLKECWKIINEPPYVRFIGDHMETLMCHFKPLRKLNQC